MWPQLRGWRHHFETPVRRWATERAARRTALWSLVRNLLRKLLRHYAPGSGLVAADEPRSLSTVPSNVGSLKTSNKPTMENTTRVPITTEAVVSTTQYHITGYARTLVRSCLGPDDLREHPMGSFRLERQELFSAPRPRRSLPVRLRLSPTACPRRVHRFVHNLWVFACTFRYEGPNANRCSSLYQEHRKGLQRVKGRRSAAKAGRAWLPPPTITVG